MEANDFDQRDGKHLSRIFDAGAPGRGNWQPHELGPLWTSQLAASLVADLAGDSAEARARVEGLGGTAVPAIRTFGDLLGHATPPLDLLVMVKAFAKATRSDSDSRLPPELATMLYYAAIIVALTRCSKRITALDDASLRAGATWAAAQPWLDEPTRALMQTILLK